MTFQSLADKLSSAFKSFRSKGKLTESDVKAGMREIKLALLEADVNFKVVKDFINKGLPIDEIGLQYHIFNTSEEMEGDMVIDTYLNVEYLLEILEIFDNYGLPMHISEITVPGSGQNEENEEIQAYLVEQLYKTWFATRNMKSIVWWNLVDGYAAYAPLGTNLGENRCGGGLLRFDMTEKPAYKVLDRLINKEWKTNFTKIVSDSELKFKGFYGEYEIIVDGISHTVNLDENGKEIVL